MNIYETPNIRKETSIYAGLIEESIPNNARDFKEVHYETVEL